MNYFNQKIYVSDIKNIEYQLDIILINEQNILI